MSGKFLLDTNAFLFLTSSTASLEKLKNDSLFFISVITELELLSFGKLTSEEESFIHGILKTTSIFNIDNDIKERTIELRRKYNIKLPDAIIAATAETKALSLITNDKYFSKIKEIKVLTVEKLLS